MYLTKDLDSEYMKNYWMSTMKIIVTQQKMGKRLRDSQQAHHSGLSTLRHRAVSRAPAHTEAALSAHQNGHD